MDNGVKAILVVLAAALLVLGVFFLMSTQFVVLPI